MPELRRSTDEGSYASSSSLESTTPASRRKFSQVNFVEIFFKKCGSFKRILQESDTKVETEQSTMYKCILSNIIDSEANYVEWLNVMLQVSVCTYFCLSV